MRGSGEVENIMYELIDNFLDKEDLEVVEGVLLSNKFPWFLNPQIDKKSSYYVGRDNLQFSHTAYAKDHMKSDWLQDFACLFERMNIFTLLRVKVNYLTRTEKRVTHDFHVDIEDSNAPKNINTSIFYLNTNNGVTIFEDTKEEVESVSNRMITFPGYLRHTGTTATDKPHRILINFNYF